MFHIRIKLVLPVHTFGRMADMPRILELAARHGAVVVEDAACALGSELDGRRAGSDAGTRHERAGLE